MNLAVYRVVVRQQGLQTRAAHNAEKQDANTKHQEALSVEMIARICRLSIRDYWLHKDDPPSCVALNASYGFQFRIAFARSLFVSEYLVSMAIRGAIPALFPRLPS